MGGGAISERCVIAVAPIGGGGPVPSQIFSKYIYNFK